MRVLSETCAHKNPSIPGMRKKSAGGTAAGKIRTVLKKVRVGRSEVLEGGLGSGRGTEALLSRK